MFINFISYSSVLVLTCHSDFSYSRRQKGDKKSQESFDCSHWGLAANNLWSFHTTQQVPLDRIPPALSETDRLIDYDKS